MVLSQSALGSFMTTDLQKALAGKQCGTQFSISNDTHGLTGTTTPKDLETFMQLVHLDFTKVGKDEKAVGNLINLVATQLKNISKNNEAVFEDSVMSTVYGNNPVYRVPTAEMVEAISYDRVLENWKTLYGNAANFTFTFVGNYDEDQLKQYICQYIASLPSTGKKTLKASDLRTFVKGDVKNNYLKKMENPQAQAQEMWRSDEVKYTLENDVLTDVSTRILEMLYNREIREKLSAAYHAGAEGSLDVEAGRAFVTISGVGKLNPEKAAVALPEFMKGMKATVAAPNQEDLNKAKQIMLKQADVDAKTNAYWRRIINRYNRYGLDFHTDYKKVVESMNAQKVSQFLQNVLLKSGNHVEVTMMPE
jgi:zinc protease